jgi:uncharacterized membrane protein
MSHSIADNLYDDPAGIADTALKAAARLWFLVAFIGLWIFVLYIVGYYASPVLQGGLEVWTNTRLPTGANVYVPDDTIGNAAMATHLMIAIIIMGFGPLQLVPLIRARFSTFHHWNGRIYLVTAIATSLGGLYMVWIRGTSSGNFIGHISISLDGVLIIIFAIMALRYAIARDIVTHRRWALRLFMVVNAVWFLRVGYRLWIFLNDGPTPYFETFFSIWGFGQYLLPLAILELYFLTQDRAGTRGKSVMAAGLVVVTGFMAIGIYDATTAMWLPRVLSVASQ